MKGVQLFVENDAQLWNEEDRGSDERGALSGGEKSGGEVLALSMLCIGLRVPVCLWNRQSMCVPVCLSVSNCMLVCPCVSVKLTACFVTCQCLCMCLSVCISVSIYLYFVRMSLHLPACLPNCFPLHISTTSSIASGLLLPLSAQPPPPNQLWLPPSISSSAESVGNPVFPRRRMVYSVQHPPTFSLAAILSSPPLGFPNFWHSFITPSILPLIPLEFQRPCPVEFMNCLSTSLPSSHSLPHYLSRFSVSVRLCVSVSFPL